MTDIPEGYAPIESSNSFGAINGPIYEKVIPNAEGGNDWVRGFMPEDRHCNMAGFVHGGMLMTFADIILSRAVLEIVKPPFVTIRLVGDFASPAFRGRWVEGHAKVLSHREDIIQLEGEISCREKTVLSVTGAFKTL